MKIKENKIGNRISTSKIKSQSTLSLQFDRYGNIDVGDRK